MNTVGERLFELPRLLGLEQQDVASAMGVSKQRYHGWASNNRVPPGDALLLLKEKLGVNDVWLIRGAPAPMMIKDVPPDEHWAKLRAILPHLTEEQRARIVKSAEDSAAANQWRPQQ